MSDKKLRLVHLIYDIVMSVVLCVLAVLFVVSCIDIYKSGPEPFTRANVYSHFRKIAVFTYASIGLALVGIILNIVAPLESKKLKGKVSEATVLKGLYKKLPSVSASAKKEIDSQRTLRFVLIALTLVLLLTATVLSLVLTLTTHNFDDLGIINNQVAKSSIIILCCFIVPFALAIATMFICSSSLKKELSVVKNELKIQKTATGVSVSSVEADKADTAILKMRGKAVSLIEKTDKPSKRKKYISIGIKCTVCCVGILFVILGIFNGGFEDVIAKATAICTECIGMG